MSVNSPLTINIIGAGRLGKTIARLIHLQGIAQFQGICNRSFASAHAAVEFIGAGKAVNSIEELPKADILFITTPDDHIATIDADLFELKTSLSPKIVIHCSGLLSSDILKNANKNGCFVASIHPMYSFADSKIAVTCFPGTFCGYEGSTEALAIILPLFIRIGAKVFAINKEQKALYHAAGVIASNYFVTLAHAAQQCLIKTGIEESQAYEIIIALMQSTMANLQNSCSFQAALTGPIQRGDTITVAQHLNALAKADRLLRELYCNLGKITLDLAAL